MRFNECVIVIVSLIMKLCATQIVIQTSESYRAFTVNKAAIDVIASCYVERGNAVGVVGIVSDNLVKELSKKIPVVLVTNSTGIALKDSTYGQVPRYRLRIFVLTVTTPEELEIYIKELRRTIWWNHLASFLILYQAPRGCKSSELLLVKGWTLRVIDAKILCFDRQAGIQILAFNPYIPKAPEPWRIRIVYQYKFINSQFAVFYRHHDKIGANWNFEKTKNLNGYPVEQLYLMRGTFKHTGNNKNIRDDATMYANVVNTIIRVINGTDKIVTFDWYRNDATNISDLFIGIVPLVAGRHYIISRPFIRDGMVAMTQHSGHMSQLQKIFAVVDVYTNISVCITLIGVSLFFKFVVGLDTLPAILNTIRIITNAGFLNLPRNTSSRFYVATVLTFIVTMQGIYLGNLASLLTTVVQFPNVNTWNDLMNSHHTMYIHKEYKYFLDYPEFEGRVVLMRGRGDCSQYVLRDSSVACVNYEAVLKDQAEHLRLHLTELLKPSMGVIRFRRNWPLQERFNDLLAKLYEADVVMPFHLRNNRKTLGDFKYDDDVKSNQAFRNMRLNDMIFAFVILGIGLTCASITFFFEIIFYRIQLKNRDKIISFFIFPTQSSRKD